MMHLRRTQERGYADHGWLKSHHSFSFASYYDRGHMMWGNLRVLNEDRIAPGTGFGAHPHQDMEIVSVVLHGALSHEDSMGNIQTIYPGDVQRMTAGTGVVHSERNEADTTTHFLQIWLLPLQQGLTPGYEQKHFSTAQKTNQLRLVASPDGVDGSVHLNADARIYASVLQAEHAQKVQLDLALKAHRKAYVFVIEGAIEVEGKKLTTGDALLIDNEAHVLIASSESAEFLVFDLAA